MEQLALTRKLTDWLNLITGRRMAGSSGTLDEMLRVEREMKSGRVGRQQQTTAAAATTTTTVERQERVDDDSERSLSAVCRPPAHQSHSLTSNNHC